MEASVLLDFAFGLVAVVVGFIVKRIFVITDRLAESDRQLHDRVTKVQTQYVSKADFSEAVDRIIDCINRLESKMER